MPDRVKTYMVILAIWIVGVWILWAIIGFWVALGIVLVNFATILTTGMQHFLFDDEKEALLNQLEDFDFSAVESGKAAS